jgi:TRAP-type C4-dicarboxylate transport system permease small subunit
VNLEPEAAPEADETGPLFNFFHKISTVGVVAGGVALVAITAIVTYDVVMRFLGHPTIWAAEVSGYLLIAVAVLGAADTLRRNEHFGMTLLIDTFSPERRRWVSLVTWSLVFLLVAGLVWGIVQLIGNSLRFGLRSYTILQAPLALPQIVLLLGFVALTVAVAARLIALVRRIRASSRTE